MIPKEIVNEILQKADIVQVISSYITVSKKGNSLRAVCPFHNDTNPSMHISQTKQIFHCFACDTGGNAFTFVQKYEKISFQEAVKKVASLINFDSPLLKTQTRTIDDNTKNTLKVLNDARELYHYVLSTNAGEKGKNYLIERNISNEMIDYFSLGFSPENGELTIKQLRSKDNSVESLENAGILLRNNNNFTDRFRNRIIFPIFNEYSEVVGFSARIIDKSSDAKYVNTPSTDLFNKSNLLYNYQNAKNEAKNAGYCYVVEGFMDVFSLYRIGIKSVVALMGTAFTNYHAKLLKKLGVEIRLCLDGDEAGKHGMARMCLMLDKMMINYQIVDYENDLRDPDEIYNQDGPVSLNKRVNTLVKKDTFLIKYLLTKYDVKTIDGKKEFINALSKTLTFDDDIEYEAIIKEISAITSISSSALKQKIRNGENINFDTKPIKQKKFEKNKAIKQQRELIFYLLKNNKTREIINKYNFNPFISEKYMLISNYIEEAYCENPNSTFQDIISLIQQMNGSDSLDTKKENKTQELISEITNIQEDDNHPEFDEIIIDEIMENIKGVIDKIQQKELYDHISRELDEVEKAKILDKFRK